jgi:predicted RNA methylase
MKSTRTRLRSLAIATSHLPLIRSVVHAKAMRDRFRDAPVFRSIYQGLGYETAHPFDRVHGTDTSGFTSSSELPRGERATDEPYWGAHYWGSQPSFIRAAINALPPPETFTFIDLGCGKGRALFVASEFAFRDIVGVELSAKLAAIARHNAALIAEGFPTRTPVSVEEGDAGAVQVPPGNVVVYLYNPFGEDVLRRVLSALEAALAQSAREVYIVYMFPHLAQCIDASPLFKRFFETEVEFAPEERGYGHVEEGRFTIWRASSAG